MVPRVALAGLAAGAIAVLVLIAAPGSAQNGPPSRISFLIATGPSGGTYFPVGQIVAGLISNPPGAGRCRAIDACGPEGLMASARTSNGAVANVLAVDSGDVDSGFAQADVVAEALAGAGPFKKMGRPLHIGVLSGLFSEQVHLVVASRSHIASVRDLRKKRVSLGPTDSGTYVTAHEVLAAYGLSERDVKATHDSFDLEAEKLQSGKLDAFFFVGASPVPLIANLIASGTARLAPIGGRERDKLSKSVPALRPDRILANVYSGTPATDTVRVRAVWVVRDTLAPSLAYGILKALYNPANRTALDDVAASRTIRVESGARDLPAPLNRGAWRFFHENGKV